MKWFDYGHKVSSISSLKINLSGDSKATLNSPCAKGYYLTQKLEPASVRLSVIVYLAIITLAISFFFHNLTFWRYEGFKNLLSHTQQKKQVQVFLSINLPWHSGCKNLDHCPQRNIFFIYQWFQIFIHPGKCFNVQTYGNI